MYALICGDPREIIIQPFSPAVAWTWSPYFFAAGGSSGGH
jgi:hypothetical protein